MHIGIHVELISSKPNTLTLQFLDVSVGPTLVDFCHLSESGPCCSADSMPKDPLRHNMLMVTRGEGDWIPEAEGGRIGHQEQINYEISLKGEV